MAQVARASAGATEDLAVDDETAANAAQPAEVDGDGVRLHAKLVPDSMQGCQLAVVRDADVHARNAQLVQCRADLRAERKIAPFRVFGEPHRGAICGYVARNADLDCDQVLLGRQPVELRTQLALKFGKASVGRSPAEIGRHAVPPQLATCESCGRELEAIQV